MPPLVKVLTGPAGCGKTDRLLERYRAVLSTAPPGSTLWLAPTSRAAAEIRSRLLGGKLDGCFAPGISTFARFAETVLHAASQSPTTVRPSLTRAVQLPSGNSFVNWSTRRHARAG